VEKITGPVRFREYAFPVLKKGKKPEESFAGFALTGFQFLHAPLFAAAASTINRAIKNTSIGISTKERYENWCCFSRLKNGIL